MPTWEYKTLPIAATGILSGGDINLEQLLSELNQLGSQGWELVSVFNTSMHGGTTREVVAVLKRQPGA